MVDDVLDETKEQIAEGDSKPDLGGGISLIQVDEEKVGEE